MWDVAGICRNLRALPASTLVAVWILVIRQSHPELSLLHHAVNATCFLFPFRWTSDVGQNIPDHGVCGRHCRLQVCGVLLLLLK